MMNSQPFELEIAFAISALVIPAPPTVGPAGILMTTELSSAIVA